MTTTLVNVCSIGGNVILFKRCPKCVGDLVLQSEAHENYWRCFQCGKHIEIGYVAPPKNAPVARVAGVDIVDGIRTHGDHGRKS